MTKENLNEREFELVNIIGPSVNSNQRDLSRQMNISLGMINMLLRRLITKGYIRTRQLNQKKVQYILTPKGFSEKMRKSVKYTMKTVNSIGSIKSALERILTALYAAGERDFVILGGSDFSLLVEMVLHEKFPSGYKLKRINEFSAKDLNGGMLLICKEDVDKSKIKVKKSVNLIEELAKQAVF